MTYLSLVLWWLFSTCVHVEQFLLTHEAYCTVLIPCSTDWSPKPIANMPICGPKLSLCTLIVSIWAVIQLVCFVKSGLWGWPDPLPLTTLPIASLWQPIMGVLYYIRSVALLEDLPIKPHYINPHTFFKEADEAFELVSFTSFYHAHKSNCLPLLVTCRSRTTAGLPHACIWWFWCSPVSNSSPTDALALRLKTVVQHCRRRCGSVEWSGEVRQSSFVTSPLLSSDPQLITSSRDRSWDVCKSWPEWRIVLV